MKELRIKWLGQSGYLLSDGETEICIDPYLSDLVEELQGHKRMVAAPVSPEELRSDVVICTHNHIDHVDYHTISRMNTENTLFLAPKHAEETLKKYGVINYRSFDVGETVQKGDFVMTAIYAEHTVDAVGVIVQHHQITMYFSGDTLYSEELELLSKFNIDMSFICINGKLGNMDVNEAVKLTRILNPVVAVPTHYGMFENNTEDPQKYISQLENGFEMEHGREYTVGSMLQKTR